MDDEELDLDGLLGGVGDGAGDAYAGLSPRSRRKRKNRDQMRAARQREKETMERLHAMVERLESQFRKLQQQKQNGASVAPAIKCESGPTAPPSSTAVITPAAYADALSTKARYQEENFHLKQTLYEKNKLKETLERHVGDYVEPTPEERHILAAEFPEAGDGPVKPEPAATPQGDDADGTNAYTPLSEGAVWAIIADVHRRMAMIKQSLLGGVPGNGPGTPQSRLTITVLSSSPSPSPAGANDTPVASDDEFTVPGGGYSTPQSSSSASPSPSPATPPASAPPSSGYTMPPFLGWEVRHEVVSNHLRFYFEKSFGHISAFEAMVRMWDNERSMYSYRDVPLAGRQTLGVVQQLNDDTYVFQRRLADASTGHRELVSTYLRYRLRTNEGFLIGSVSIDDDILAIGAENPRERDVRDRAWAAKLYLWTEFIPIHSDSGCCVRMSGSVNLDTPAASQRNIANLVIGLLRWENLHIGPIFALADR